MKLQKLTRKMMTKRLRNAQAKTPPILKAPRLNLLELEDRLTPATIPVTIGNLNGWVSEPFNDPGNPVDTSAIGFVSGPSTAPLTVGSARLTVGVDGNDAVRFGTNSFGGTLLSDLQALSYSTYVQQHFDSQAPYLVLRIDTNNDGLTDDRLFFEPVYQTAAYFPSNPQAALALNTWQTWDAFHGGWRSESGTAGAGSGVNGKSLATIFAAYPAGAKLATDVTSLRVQAGGGAPSWNNFIGYADNLSVTVAGNNTTYDFGSVPSNVYVNSSWTGTAIGADPDGAGPAVSYGLDSFATIQTGVNGVANGGTVNVAAGTYAESVTINKGISLLGAQAGVDARTRSGAESVVSGDNGITPIWITASGVTVDGFTIQGGTNPNLVGAGVYLAPGTSGTHFANNIVQNNIIGLYLENDSSTTPTVLEKNLFRDNTVAGPGSGQSIYADDSTTGGGLQNVLIQDNAFTNTSAVEDSWAIGFSNIGNVPFSNVTIQNNTVTNSGRGFYFYGTTNPTITGNTVTGATRYAIGFFDFNPANPNSGANISNNTFVNDFRGIYLEDGGNGAFTGTLTQSGNSFTGGTYSIYVVGETLTFTGTLTSSIPAYVGLDGILIVDGTINGPVTVDVGGKLMGVGTITGTVTNNGTVAPGHSPGILNTGNYSQTGTLDIEFVNPAGTPVAGTDYDQVNVTGTVSLAGTLNVALTGTLPVPVGTVVKIINNDGTSDPVSGTFAGLANASTFTAGGQLFQIFYDGGDGNDVVLLAIAAAPALSTVYVDDDWASLANGVDPDGAGPRIAMGYDSFNTIQKGVNAVATGGTVNVAGGTYLEDVTVGTDGLHLLGAGPGLSIISGVFGGDVATVRVGASNVEIAGFTITREGNNATDWNNSSLNSAGIAIQGLSVTGASIHDNLVTGNRSGIDVNNSNGHTIRNNVVTNNHTGLIFRNQTDGLLVTENAIVGNRTVGVVFLNANTGPVQQALGSVFTNNDISGNWYGQIVDRQIGTTAGNPIPAPGTSNLKDFSGNWFGTATPVVTTANSTEPAYGLASLPVAFGGTATAPGGQPDVAGPASANFDITPLLTSGTDTDVETTPGRGTYGFQGSHTNLNVLSAGAQVGATGRIQEGVDLVDAAGTVNVAAGTYTGSTTVNKSVNLVGAAGHASAVSAVGSPTVFTVAAPNVTIDGFAIQVDQRTPSGQRSNPNAAVFGNTFDGLQVLNNTFAGTATEMRAVYLPANTLTQEATLKGNSFDATGGGYYYRTVETRDAFSTVVGGPNVADGNVFKMGFAADLHLNFIASGGSATVENNVFNAGGVVVAEPNGGATVSIANNQFAPISPLFDQALFINHNYTTATVDVTGNTFTGAGTAINSLGSHNLTVSGNTFNAGGQTNFTYLKVNTFNASTPTYAPNDLVLTGNTFNASTASGANGTVLAISNTAPNGSNPDFGTLTVGGAGAAANAFKAGAVGNTFANFIRVNSGASVNFDASGNTFDVTDDGVDNGATPAASTGLQLYALEDKIFHAVDSVGAGFVRVKAANVYVTPASGSIQRGADAATTGDTVNVASGSYTGNVDLGAGADKALNLSAGASPGTVTINGNLTLTSNDTLTVDIAGSGAGQYDQLIVNGTVDLGGSTLVLNQTVAPTLASVLTLIDNDGSDPVTGTFLGLPEGATIVAGGTSYKISYVGGINGNDVTLTRSLPPTNITLDNNSIAENAGLNALVGTFSTTDPDFGDVFTYTFVGSGGDYDYFTLDSSTGELRAVDSFDFETQATSYTLQVRSTDLSGFSVVRTFTINVTDVNDVPYAITSSPDPMNVNENSNVGTVVGTVTGYDYDTTSPNNTLTYGFSDGLGGTSLTSPDGLFAIDPVTGVVTVNSATLNFEALDPLNPYYFYFIRATDGPGLYVEVPFAIVINNVNEAPSDLATAGLSVNENSPAGTAVGSVTSVDPDTVASGFGTLTYSLLNDAGGRFVINAATGAVTVKPGAVLDFEANPTHSITVQVTDGTFTKSDTFTVNVLNVNEAPTALQLSNNILPENAGANFAIGTFTTTDQDIVNGDTFTYTLVAGGPDNGYFDIVGNQLVARGSFNFESQNVFQINVRTLDSGGLSFTQAFTITVTNVNEAPTNINATSLSVAENSTNGTFVGTATGFDPDTAAPFNTLTYSLTNDAGGRFTIDPSTGAITVADGSLLNFEANPSHSITVRATDGGTPGLFFEKTFTVTVTNVNETPTDITGVLTVPENSANGTSVGTATGIDPDTVAPFNTLTYVLTNNAGGRFAINSSTGAITVTNGSLLDYEANTSHSITVQVTDGGGLTFTKVLTVSVTNVNEAPTDITATTLTVPENSATNTPVGTATGVDPDTIPAFNTLTYSLTNNAGGRFQIDSTTGAITVLNGSLLDYETNTSHSITVQVSDGTFTFSKAFTVTVTNVNEAPTDITATPLTVPENSPVGTVVGTATGVDPDAGTTFSYSLTNNAGGLFAINPTTGVITVATAALDFETNPSPSITIQVSDGSLTFSKVFTVTVTDVNEAPTNINLGSPNVPENAGVNAAVGLLTSTGDPDTTPQTYTYTLVSGAGDNDNALFNINPINNRLRANNSFDFETKSSYTVRVRSTDQGGAFVEKAFTVTVINVNEAPTDITATALTVPENSANGTVVGTATGVDPDTVPAFNTLTYSLTNNAGGRFQINSATGVVTVANGSLLDYETNTSHSITVQVSDGTFTFSKAFTVSVTNVNEAPTNITTTPTSLTIPENSTNGTFVGTALGVDPDAGTTFTYSLTDTAGGRFAINPLNGIISVANGSLLDFETNTSHSITVQVSDGSLTFSKAFTVAVTNVNEAPTNITTTPLTVPENSSNGTIVGTATGVDPDAGSSLTYSLTDNAGGRFAINALTGVITVANGTLLDYETNTSHSITIQVSDGSLTFSKAFTVAVTDVNEGPTNNVPGIQTVNEDTVLAFTGGNAISVSNLEGATATVQLTVANGKLTVSLAGGASISAGANGSSTLTLMGNQAKVNAALATLTYQGSPDYYGSDTLTVLSTDTDAVPQTDSDTVAISVLPVADIVNDRLYLNGLNTVTANLITGTNGASADTFSNPGRSLTGVSTPSKGTVTFAANGTINYTPNFAFTGTDTFTYTVTSAGKSETGTVTIGGPSQSTFLTSSSISGQPVRQYSVSGVGSPATATGLQFNITGAAKVAYADVNGDGTEDVIVGTVNGSTSLVTVYNGLTAALMNSFTPFVAGAVSAIYVAAGDVNGDGKADITVSNGSASTGANSNVRVYDGAYVASGKAVVSASVGGTVAAQGRLRDFYGLSNTTAASGNGTTFTANTGATVAMGDFNGDGLADIVVGTVNGGTSRVVIYDAKVLLGSNAASAWPKPNVDLTVYNTGSSTGVTVAAGDINGDGRAELVTGALSGGANIRVFTFAAGSKALPTSAYATFTNNGSSITTTTTSGTAPTLSADFLVGATNSGVRVAVRDLNNDGYADILYTFATNANGASTYVGAIDGNTLRTAYASTPYQLQTAPPLGSAYTLLTAAYAGVSTGAFVA